MPSIGRPSGTRPTWYRRLPPSLQRVAEQSDRVSSLPLRAGPALADAVLLLPDALRSEDAARVEAVCCEGSLTTLFIGVLEHGGPHFDTRGAPVGSDSLLPARERRGRDRITL
jgi:hypothetical protein